MNHSFTVQVASKLILSASLFISSLAFAQLPSQFETVQYSDGYGKLKWGLSSQALTAKLGGQTVTDVKKPKPSQGENRKRSYQTITATQEIDGVHFENTYFFVDDKFYLIVIRSEGPDRLSKSSAFAIIDKLNTEYGQAVNFDISSYVTAKMWENEKVNIELSYQDDFTYAGYRNPPTFDLKIYSIKLKKLTKP